MSDPFAQMAAELRRTADAITQDLAAEAQQILREQASPRRVRTRDAIYAEVRGTVATVGLRFRQRFPTANTATERYLRDTWRQHVVPRLRRTFAKLVHQHLKET